MSQSTFFFDDVPAHRHLNPDNTKGGWVADTAKVDASAYVEGGALVFPDAEVGPDERLARGTNRMPAQHTLS